MNTDPAADVQSSSSQNNEAHSVQTFYRAGKKADAQPSPVSPAVINATNPLQQASSAMSVSSASSEGNSTSSVESIAAQSSSAPAGDSGNTKGQDANGNKGEATHGSAFGIPLSIDSIGGYVQYISYAVIGFGGLFFLFAFMRKKKPAYATAKNGIPAPTQNKTPVDSERVRKALAAFHEEQNKPPAAPAS